MKKRNVSVAVALAAVLALTLVGAALAAEWQFPVPMVQAIVHQGQPFGQAVHDPIAGVVHIASWRSRAEELSLDGDALIRTYPDAVGGVLGLTPDIVVGEDAPTPA